MPLHKWVTIAKQAISELNLSANYEYEPIWGDNTKQFASELVKRIISAKVTSENNIQEFSRKLDLRNQGEILDYYIIFFM